MYVAEYSLVDDGEAPGDHQPARVVTTGIDRGRSGRNRSLVVSILAGDILDD